MPTQKRMADDYTSHILLTIVFTQSTTEIKSCLCGWVGSDCTRDSIHYVPLTPPTQSLFDVLEAEPRKRSYAFGEKGRPRPQI